MWSDDFDKSIEMDLLRELEEYRQGTGTQTTDLSNIFVSTTEGEPIGAGTMLVQEKVKLCCVFFCFFVCRVLGG